MNQCPSCFTDNVTGAVECRDCKTPLKATAPLCRNGHVMEPTWVECNTCRAEGRLPPRDLASRPPTRFENGGQPPPFPSAERRTTWESPLPMPGPITPPGRSPFPGPLPPPDPAFADARKTTFAPAGIPPRDQVFARATEPESRRTGQKIIAVLVTYTWLPEGQVFPVREGRNRIGSDPSQCDISLPQDDTMSGLHSSISFRTRFVISDRDSMSGTYVNGRPVEEESYPLEDYAEIRTGSTIWRFVVLSPAAEATPSISTTA